MSNIEKIKKISKPCKNNWLEIADELEHNESWLAKSASIATSVLLTLQEKGITKQELAERMGVKPQYVSRIVKGTENLTLDTICKLEESLGQSIITVNDYSNTVVAYKNVNLVNLEWRETVRVQSQHMSSTAYISSNSINRKYA